MSYDPIAQMELDHKREVVEHDQLKDKVRGKLADAARERVPKAYRAGKIMPLVFYPDTRLHQVCTPVERFDRELEELVRDMAMTMYLCGGVGLAAPQVGLTLRLVVCDWSEKRGELLHVLINPTIVVASDKSVRLEEACLSIPGGKVNLYRPEHVTIRYQDLKGKEHDLALTDWPARVAQHELDHLDGKVMLDQVSRLERRIALRGLRNIERGEKARKPKKKRRR